MSHLTDLELYYFNEGTTITPYKTLGCHRVKHDGYPMWRFTVWAPNAKRISAPTTRRWSAAPTTPASAR